MAAVCDICAKKPGFGNNRPWSRKITKRMNVCTGCLKAGKVSR